MEDAAPGPCEPFRQWVIEDRFPAGRPAWEKAGAQLVDDVMPFEIAKLRMLNGTHSTLAYLSMLAGFATIDEAIAHAPLKKLIHAMMTQEIAPTLDVPPSFDVLAYRDALLARYANAALKHRTAQIAMDGSQKIPPRLLATIEARLNTGQSIERLALAVAAWLVFLRGHADDGTRYEISDPMAARLTANVPDEPEQLVETMLAIKEVFPPELARRDDFRRPLHAAIVRLQGGARAAIEHYAALA
jgi:fructuronate reductase